MKNCFVYSLTVSFLFVFIITGCGEKQKNEIIADGRIEVDRVNVSTKITGVITKLTVGEGDKVKKGQLLGYLDLYSKTKKDLERAKDLYKGGAISEEKVEDAEITFNNQIITAPINGVVLLKVKDKGETVVPGQTILSLGDLKNVYAKVYIPEKNIESISLGQSAVITTDTLANKSFSGKITYISDTGEFTPKNIQTTEEKERRVYAVKITIDNQDEILKPGMPCSATIRFHQ